MEGSTATAPEEFLLVEEDFSRSALRGEVLNATPDETLSYLRGESRPEVTLRVRRGSGHKLHDWIWTSSPWAILISDRVVDLLRHARFTGWDTYPVELTDPEFGRVAGFSGLVITGRCGEIDFSRSNIVQIEMPSGPWPHYQGLFFGPTTWDGSDLFMPPIRAYRFATRRVGEALAAQGISNVRLERASDVQIDVDSVLPLDAGT